VYNATKKTIFTFILYLNEGFQGGETIFYPGDKKTSWSQLEPGIEVKIIPKTGTALIFFQCGYENPRHEGAQLLDGQKYILRSDLAYELIGPISR